MLTDSTRVGQTDRRIASLIETYQNNERTISFIRGHVYWKLFFFSHHHYCHLFKNQTYNHNQKLTYMLLRKILKFYLSLKFLKIGGWGRGEVVTNCANQRRLERSKQKREIVDRCCFVVFESMLFTTPNPKGFKGLTG